jgi:S-adenosyl methyltransferase
VSDGCEMASVNVPPGVDRDRPNPARIYDWFLGGSYNFAADRAAAAQATALLPELPQMLRANRAFLRRAVRYAAQAGVTQFVDLGSGLPTVGNVHTVAREVVPAPRVVYVDHDEVVAHTCRAILGDDPAVGVVHADLLDPDAVLASEAVRTLIDPSRPVCVLAVAVAHFIPDTAALRRALARYCAAVPSGSHLVMSHGNAGAGSEVGSKLIELYARSGTPLVARGRVELEALIDGWDPVAPGIVHTWQWRPEPQAFGSDEVDHLTLAVVARKP